MKVIYYSKTGNTKYLAEKFADLLNSSSEEIIPRETDPNQKDVTLLSIPQIGDDKVILFGSPVHGFQIPFVTKAYLDQLKDLNGKSFHLFVSHYFPFKILGGTMTLKQMKKVIEEKGGHILSMTSFDGKPFKQTEKINRYVKTLKEGKL